MLQYFDDFFTTVIKISCKISRKLEVFGWMCFIKKMLLKFRKVHRNRCSLSFSKVADLEACKFFKKKTLTQYHVYFTKFLKTLFDRSPL